MLTAITVVSMATSRVNDNEDISKMIKIIGFGGWGEALRKPVYCCYERWYYATGCFTY